MLIFHTQVILFLIIMVTFTTINCIHSYWYNHTPKKFKEASKQRYTSQELSYITNYVYTAAGVYMLHMYFAMGSITFIIPLIIVAYVVKVISSMHMNNIRTYKTLVKEFKRIREEEIRNKLNAFLDVKKDDYDPFK